MTSTGPLRLRYALLSLPTIALGLAVRFAPWGLPWFWSKYLGSGLWAVMVYLVVGLALPRLRPLWLGPTAFTVALLVELSRLVPQPAVDAFRLTLAGRILLGRLFSPRNLVAYAVGISLVAFVDQIVRAREQNRSLEVGLQRG